MYHLFRLIAFLSVLLAVVLLVVRHHPNVAVMVGLIGVLGAFKTRPPKDPLG